MHKLLPKLNVMRTLRAVFEIVFTQNSSQECLLDFWKQWDRHSCLSQGEDQF